jgi:hypothetical protein
VRRMLKVLRLSNELGEQGHLLNLFQVDVEHVLNLIVRFFLFSSTLLVLVF